MAAMIQGVGSNRREKMDAVDAGRVFAFETAAGLADVSSALAEPQFYSENT